MNSHRVSIIIPCYERGGTGVACLQKALDSIQKQTYTHYEVIVSDHSKDDEIENMVKEHSLKSKIRYFRNTEKRSNPSANLNFAVSKAQGEIIKPLFQDDFLLTERSLQVFVSHLTKNIHWVLVGSLMFDGNIAIYKHTRLFPIQRTTFNSLGSPSAIAYKRSVDVKFNEKYKWLLDMEFYINVQKKYGLPKMIWDTHIGVMVSSQEQLTNMLSTAEKQREKELIVQEYGAVIPLGPYVKKIIFIQRLIFRLRIKTLGLLLRIVGRN